MARKFEAGREVNLSEEGEITPEERFQQKIVEHLKGDGLESPRFQAFADFTDLQNVDSPQPWGDHVYYNRDEIMETIRQRINGVRGYHGEIKRISDMAHDYGKELEDKYIGSEVELKYSKGLMDIKNREIERRSQQTQAPQQQ